MHFYATARGGEFERIELEVQNDFLEFVAIRLHDADRRIDDGFQLDSFVICHLTGGAGQTLDEFSHIQRLAFDLHNARLESNEIEQVINQLEQPHAIGLHGDEQIPALAIKGGFVAIEQRLQRRQQQGKRRAQLMADIGEEPAFYLVQFGQLFVFLLERLFVLVQLVTQSELAEPHLAVEEPAGDDNDASQDQKINVVQDGGLVML